MHIALIARDFIVRKTYSMVRDEASGKHPKSHLVRLPRYTFLSVVCCQSLQTVWIQIRPGSKLFDSLIYFFFEKNQQTTEMCKLIQHMQRAREISAVTKNVSAEGGGSVGRAVRLELKVSGWS